MAAQVKAKQLWIGMVEVRSRHGGNAILGDTKGAFVNIVTWASDPAEYSRNAEIIAGKLGLFVAEVVNPEPVETRRQSQDGFKEEIADAIIYGTFNTFEKDDA